MFADALDKNLLCRGKELKMIFLQLYVFKAARHASAPHEFTAKFLH